MKGMKAHRNLLIFLGIVLTLLGAIIISVATFEWRGALGWSFSAVGVLVLVIASTRTAARP